MKSSLFVAFMIKFRQDFTEYKSSEKPMKMLHFSPLVLFLLNELHNDMNSFLLP
jgi:hypothetical protein